MYIPVIETGLYSGEILQSGMARVYVLTFETNLDARDMSEWD